MAKCKNCGKEVGCGCNLVNGLCAACRPIVKTETPPPPQKLKHAAPNYESFVQLIQ